MRYGIIIALLVIAAMTPFSYARITIGVSPATIDLDFTKNKTLFVNFMFWNRGDENLCLTVLGSKDVKSNITKPIEVVVPPSLPFVNSVNFPVEFYDSAPNGTYYFDIIAAPCKKVTGASTNVNYDMAVKLNVISNIKPESGFAGSLVKDNNGISKVDILIFAAVMSVGLVLYALFMKYG